MCNNCEEKKSQESKGIYFAHLHNHSHYSLLDGLGSIEQMVQGAVDNGYDALALTDHGTCAGLFRFQKECFKKGIKPIMGSEFYISEDHTSRDKNMPIYHITIIAKNRKGLENLFTLSSIAEIEGKYKKPRIDFGLLQKYHEGLICTSGCISSEVSMNIYQGHVDVAEQVILKYKDLFKDDYYIEIMAHEYFNNEEQKKREEDVAKVLFKLSKKHNIKAIATNDCHYAKKEDAEYHDILLAMQTHNHIKDPKRFTLDSDEFYIKSKDEIANKYKKVPELLENTKEIVDKISSKPLMEESADLLPSFELPEGFETEMDYLIALIKDGFVKLGFKGKQEYKERIRFELKAIEKCGYIKYFLILWDMIRYAHEQNIAVGPGRGCFVPESLVQTKNELKKIQLIRKGEFVLSYDGQYHEVLNKFEYEVEEEIFDIELEDGKVISCTNNHKIHVVRDGELVWVEAQDLSENDDIYEIEELEI